MIPLWHIRWQVAHVLVPSAYVPLEVPVAASVNTGQQLGGSIGTALLNTIAASATTSYLASHLHGRPVPQLAQLALIHGYTTVFWWCAGIFVADAVICGALLRPGPLTRPEDIPARKPSPQAAPARS